MEHPDQTKPTSRWLGAPIEEVAGASPVVALARARGTALQPYLLNIRATMTDTTSVVGPFTWSITGGTGGTPIENTRLSQFAILDRMIFQVDQPNANTGSALKPISDFFFRFQSGILATLAVDGGPRFTVSSDFTPLSGLCAMVNEAWAYGWVLGYTQSCKMQFAPSSLMTVPTTVTVTFRLWQALQDAAYFVGMTDGRAIDELAKMGVTYPQRLPRSGL
jgi:hypothetical protein